MRFFRSGEIFSPDREHQFARMREVAREVFSSALTNASIEAAFARNVHCERRILRIGEDLHHLDSYNRVFVVSIGKAAHTMAAALEHIVGSNAGSNLEGHRRIVGRASEPNPRLPLFLRRPSHSHRRIHSRRRCHSQIAGRSRFQCARHLYALRRRLFHRRKASRTMNDALNDEEISLADLAATYRALVHSGAPIAEINAIRKHLSAVKGGRLAQAAYPAQQVSILVSDVPDDTPDALASGPTMPDSTSVHDCDRIAAKYNLIEQFPKSVADLFRQHALEETPKSDDPAFIRARWWTVLSNKVAIEQAAAAAAKAGFAVEVDNSCDDQPLRPGRLLPAQSLNDLRNKVSRVCLISGGEVTVTVRNGGIGGRNQQFALACAEKISGRDITVLSAGTDGIDGNSPAAGAVVDGSTIRWNAKGRHAEPRREVFVVLKSLVFGLWAP
jgi:glycerate 2-kinase